MIDQLTPDERAALRARIVGGARDIKPAGAHRGAWIAGSVAALLVVALAGGVAATTTLSAPPIANTPSPSPTATVAPVPTPTASQTPTPTAPPARIVAQPASRFSFGCADVAPFVASFFGGEVPEIASTIPRLTGNAWLPGPMQYSFEQAGALYCEFGELNGRSAEVSIVPDAEGVVEHHRAVLGDTCSAEFPCELIEGAFLSVVGTSDGEVGRTPEDDALSAVAASQIGDLIRASPPSASRWVPPTGSRALPGECATVLPPERLGPIVGIPDLKSVEDGWGGWSVQAWMLDGYWDAPLCHYYPASATNDLDTESVRVTWLPGGEWAFDAAVTGQPISATGGRTTDAARLSEGPLGGGTVYYADVLVDGNWVRVALPWSMTEGDRPAAVKSIAELVFEGVYG